MAGRRILVVDDEVDILNILQDYLGSQGYTVVCVETGREAIDILEAGQLTFDAALVDWTIPGIQGGDVVQQIVAHQPTCKVFAITGHQVEMVLHSNAGSLVTGIFRKPFSLKLLHQELKKKVG
jgi:CheY-like chemotaxis protein